MYTDGILVTTTSSGGGFNTIKLEDFWVDGNIGNVYFDDVSVY